MIKRIVHAKINICWKCTQAIQDVDECVSSSGTNEKKFTFYRIESTGEQVNAPVQVLWSEKLFVKKNPSLVIKNFWE